MPESLPISALERVGKLLIAHGVEFIVVGGQAEWAYGSPRVTLDVDLCYRRTPANLERLAAALREIKPTLRNAPPDLPFIIDARTLEMGSNFTFNTPIVDLDLLGWVEPIGDMDMAVIDLDDLIRIKQHIGRDKDKGSLVQLLAIKRIRDEQGIN